jgi:hypothetical protein
MTEAEWLTCTDPMRMLIVLTKASERKLRLFSCACCRHVWHLLPDDANRALVAAIEDCPDAARRADPTSGTLAGDPTVNEALYASSRGEDKLAAPWCYWAVKNLGRSFYKMSAWESATIVVWHVAQTLQTEDEIAAEEDIQAVGRVVDRRYSELTPIRSAEGATQTALLREVFGNPFREVTINPSWLAWNDATVSKIAHAIYEERAFDRLPILADALEDAGCDDADILAHCRSGGPHVRGCWVVDLLLGKS